MNMRNVVPRTTLPRYNCTKKIWLAPAKLKIEDSNNEYEISFLTRRNSGVFKVVCRVPKSLEITDRFKCALTAYACEGTNQTKGLYSKFCGQKTRNVHITNSDPWILRIVIDEFEKLGMKREKWRIRLQIFSQHNEDREKLWWSKKLHVNARKIKCSILKGDLSKDYMEPHGRAKVEVESVVFGSLVANLISLLKANRI